MKIDKCLLNGNKSPLRDTANPKINRKFCPDEFSFLLHRQWPHGFGDCFVDDQKYTLRKSVFNDKIGIIGFWAFDLSMILMITERKGCCPIRNGLGSRDGYKHDGKNSSGYR